MAKSSLEDERVKTFISALKSEDYRRNSAAGILMEKNTEDILRH